MNCQETKAVSPDSFFPYFFQEIFCITYWNFIGANNCFVWFLCFNNISVFIGYLMPDLSLRRTVVALLTSFSWDGGIRGKALVQKWTAQLEFELSHYNFPVQHISHYTTGGREKKDNYYLNKLTTLNAKS